VPSLSVALGFKLLKEIGFCLLPRLMIFVACEFDLEHSPKALYHSIVVRAQAARDEISIKQLLVIS